MFCQNCGREAADSNAKCDYCGQVFGETPYDANAQQQSNAQQQPYNPYGQPQQPYNPYEQGNAYPPDPNAPPQAYNPYAPPTPNSVPKAKNASLANGILSIILPTIAFFILGFLALGGLVCGITAISTAKKSPSPAAAYVVGIIGTIWSAICTVLWFLALGSM